MRQSVEPMTIFKQKDERCIQGTGAHTVHQQAFQQLLAHASVERTRQVIFWNCQIQRRAQQRRAQGKGGIELRESLGELLNLRVQSCVAVESKKRAPEVVENDITVFCPV